MFIGGGANGKGTFLKLVERFLDEVNVSHISIQDIGEDKFSTAQIYRKLANVFADLGKTEIKNTGPLKMLVSGDLMSAQHKHQHRFEFRAFAKLMFSANEVPESADKTYAFFRRWIIFSFEKIFQHGDDADVDLIDKLSTQEELSGLLNLALIGLTVDKG